MEATSELLAKLQQRRERMGERSPLRDMDNTPSEPRTKDFNVVVKVGQRRSCFEGRENQATSSAPIPGKLDLGRWEQPLQEETEIYGRGRKWRRPPLAEANSENDAPRFATPSVKEVNIEVSEALMASEEIFEIGDCALEISQATSSAQAEPPAVPQEWSEENSSPESPPSSPLADSQESEPTAPLEESPVAAPRSLACLGDAPWLAWETVPSMRMLGAESPKPAESASPPMALLVESPAAEQAESPASSESELELELGSNQSVLTVDLHAGHLPSDVGTDVSAGGSAACQIEVGALALGSQAPSYDFGRRQGWPGRHLGHRALPKGLGARPVPSRPSSASSSPASGASGPSEVALVSDVAVDERAQEAEDLGTQILKPLQAWDERLPSPAEPQNCVYRRLSISNACPASPTLAKEPAAPTSAASCDIAGMVSEVNSPSTQDGLEPLEYFLLDYAGELPDAVVGKLKVDLEIHEDFVRELWQRNEKLRLRARRLQDSEASPSCDVDPRVANEERRRELVARGAVASIAAAQEVNKRVASEAYEAAMQAKLARRIHGTEAQIATMMRTAEKTDEECRKKKRVAALERAKTQRDFENITDEIGRTEANLADLEEAIRNEGQRFRTKEEDRKAVAREVEALRCEARAHRARAGKQIRTEQRIESLTRELEATHAKTLVEGASAATSTSTC